MTAALDWLLADRTRGGPGTGPWVVGQWPNPALIVFLAAVVLRMVTGPDLDAVLLWVSRGALLVWGLDELARGVNPFRRTAGVAVLAWQLAALATS